MKSRSGERKGRQRQEEAILRRFRYWSWHLRLTAAAVFTALGVMAVAPAGASALCATSVPSGASNFTDPTGDAGQAPDVSTVNNALDSACRLRTEVLLTPLRLEPDQYILVRYDRDDPPQNPAEEVADVSVAMNDNGALLYDGVSPPQPLPTFGQYGFTVTLDQLGIARSPTSLGVIATGVFDPTPAGSGGEVLDDAPDAPPMHRVPVSFAGPAPPPPPPPVAPASKKKSCVVPKVKRLTVRKAKRRLKKAGCRYRVKGRGRVRWTSPKAGTLTIKTVRVRAKPKRRAGR